MSGKKSYIVEIEALTTHQFIVPECNTAEEAEAIAEEWFHDGEAGTILLEDLTRVDSYPDTPKEEFN